MTHQEYIEYLNSYDWQAKRLKALHHSTLTLENKYMTSDLDALPTYAALIRIDGFTNLSDAIIDYFEWRYQQLEDQLCDDKDIPPCRLCHQDLDAPALCSKCADMFRKPEEYKDAKIPRPTRQDIR